MARSDFVGKKLFNIKDKLPTNFKPQNQKETKESDILPVSEKKDVSADMKKQEILGQKEVNEATVPTPDVSIVPKSCAQIETEKKEEIDKHLLKALKQRKADYLRTKEVVLKTLEDTVGGLLKDSKGLETKLESYQNVVKKLKDAVSEISAIDESKWDDCDFSLELADAGKIVEHARIESIICKDKFKVSDEITEKLNSKNTLTPADFFSSTFSQLFKFGFKLFLPLIFGIIIAALVIAIAILISMGIL